MLILAPDSTASKVFNRWQGPATVIKRKSAHSYLVELNGVTRHLHADKLRKYHVSVQEVSLISLEGHICTTEAAVGQCAIIYDKDRDFGDIEVVNTSHEKGVELPQARKLIRRNCLICQRSNKTKFGCIRPISRMLFR